MIFKEMAIKGAWKVQSNLHNDERGLFFEWFKNQELKKSTGLDFKPVQGNSSVSKKGVIRGIHYSLAKPGQDKWVTCLAGSVWDVIVDLRVGSPTFKQWIGLELSENSGISVVIESGLGHGFLSLKDNSVLNYLLTSEYDKNLEKEVNVFDSELNIKWNSTTSFLSQKDIEAKSLEEMRCAELLPIFDRD